MYLPPGPRRPDVAELEAFWQRSCERSPDLTKDLVYQIRWIGLDQDSTEKILERIVSRDKTGTFSLPWVIERTEQPDPRPGDPIILIDFAGKPRVLVRLTKVYTVAFGDISEEDIAVDGAPVRSLEVWKPMHTQYWNAQLAPFGLEVSGDMPVLVEAFEVLPSG